MELGFLGWQSGPGAAKNPRPPDGDGDIPFDVTLSWTAGEFAATHDVYVGASLEAVEAAGPANTADVLFTSLGQSGTTYEFAAPLEFGQIYYWRVDEVNAPPDSTVFAGKVWSFTVEPYSYEITGVKATASSSAKDMEAEKTVDGSGLTGDQHLTTDTTMWLTAGGTTMTLPAWIQYEFPQSCKLHQMRVWNSNQNMESFVGYGAKEVTIDYSLDGVEWTKLRDQQLEQAPGDATYEGEVIALDGVNAKFVRLTIHSNWRDIYHGAGLSEVRFFDVPVRARAPQPASGMTGVAVDSVLSWRAGREAAAHKVYLSTDQQAVIDGTAPVEIVTESTFAPDALEYGQTYYWKVSEVNEAATPNTWEGGVWSFSTAGYAVIDDFESYTNDSPKRLFQTWIDGWGFSADDFFPVTQAGNGTGAAVGHDIWSVDSPHYDKSIAETVVVRAGGKQSMPLYFDNTGVATSEAQRALASQDWTAHGVKSLSLWFYGTPGNTGTLYVKINNTKISYDGNTKDIATKAWQPWNIDLATVGASLTNVTKLVIGVEGAGAKGLVYIDDIRLYPKTPQFVTPVDPGKTGLLAEYLFENGATDTSGNGYHGTLLDNAQTLNSVLVLDGTNDAVAIPRLGGATATFKSCTYSMWLFSNVAIAAAGPVGGINFNDWSAGGIHCKLYNGKANAGINGLQGNDMNGTTIVGAQEWVHLALTVVNDKATLYLNGKAEASRTSTKALNMILGSGCIGAWNKAGDIQRELNGQMDDVRVFDRALSQEELLWLIGKRVPVHIPF